VWDITSKPLPAPSADGAVPPRTFSLPEGVEPGTVDVLTVIYVLSALHPTEWDQAIHNLYSVSRTEILLGYTANLSKRNVLIRVEIP
jgi:tRNAThr (cytosine32-N3)-methyltransferase